MCFFYNTDQACLIVFSLKHTPELYIYLFFYLTSCFHLTSFHVIFFSLPFAMHSFFWKNILYPISRQVSFMCIVTDGAGAGSTSSWNLWILSHCFCKFGGDTFRLKSRKSHPTSMNMSQVANSCLLCWKYIWKRIVYFIASSKQLLWIIYLSFCFFLFLVSMLHPEVFLVHTGVRFLFPSSQQSNRDKTRTR